MFAVISYFWESGDRQKQKHYQAWQVINTAQGKGGSGGRIEALQELNADKVPLVGVDVAGAFLYGIKVRNANLMRGLFAGADSRQSDWQGSDFSYADLRNANFRGGNLHGAKFLSSDMEECDLNGVDLTNADFTGANLNGADLSNANLAGIKWSGIKSMDGANILGARNPPTGFFDWARAHGASAERDTQPDGASPRNEK